MVHILIHCNGQNTEVICSSDCFLWLFQTDLEIEEDVEVILKKLGRIVNSEKKLKIGSWRIVEVSLLTRIQWPVEFL